MSKPTTYVLTISQVFPKTHIKAGLPTGFVPKINGLVKLHTIRGNYPLWKKRFEKIEKGEACLSVRCWEGKPYNSKQVEVFNFKNTDGIGIQDLYFDSNKLTESFVSNETSKDGFQHYVSNEVLAENDGLSLMDFQWWFKNYDLNEPMAIIHFTDFRY